MSFEILHRKLKEYIQIEAFNQDTLRTLNLYDNNNGYNNAAAILADTNHFPGIDIVKFGANISIIQKGQPLKTDRYWKFMKSRSMYSEIIINMK